MQFHEAANFLFDLRRYPPRPGIDATEALLATVDDPHEDLRAVQIAGSNGKGSTARMVESTLREAGLSVGLYTSPHLDDVRERIRVDGRKITEGAVVEFAEAIRPYVTEQAADGEPPTFFETLTALALWEFDRQDVDVAVLEVGIGGRLDATSVVDPVASAVTSVTLEHTDVLGDTIEEIATDKAHVAPADRPLVTATEGAARQAVEDTAGDLCTVGGEDDDVSVSYEGIERAEGQVNLSGDGWSVAASLPLVGRHQADNAGVAAALVRQVATVDEATLARGLGNAHWPGRFEVMSRDPLVVLDGAHNPGSCQRVTETLSAFSFEDLHVVAGAMVDKDHRGIAAALSGADRVVACRPDVGRAEDEAVLAQAFEAETDATVQTRADVAGALASVLAEADEDDAV
ncbi:dihydropteroate synthase, partial [Halapricum sp. CBA1109]|uniref:bifunctional folylpolyglutamate synthase/dihydrofolate synthase n=1 Tax=Halapricum sp. CBA1109 TaxID=2668068 RepID=UPI0013B5B9E9